MAGLQAQYRKRIQKEFTGLQTKQPQGITVSLSDDNLYMWDAAIPGPGDSLYEGGRFHAQIILPEDYPLKPPMIRFVDKLPYHLNVNQSNGQVCLGFLSESNWSTSCTIEQVVNAVFSLLSRPEPSNSMDHELLNKYHHFRWEYDNKAKSSAKATVK